VASGWISPKAMRNGMIAVFAAAFFSGCLLIPWGGSWLLLVGVISILCGVAYTGGPYPLGYNGWGDVFVFIFFGWVATGVTYYVQAGTFSVFLPTASGLHWNLLAGMVPGALATNLLVVNNVRDEPLDREAGKHTLAVRFGRAFGRTQYAVLLILALAVPLVFAGLAGLWGCLLVLLAVPLAVIAWRRLATATDRATYDAALGLTALLLIVVGGLFTLGLAL
jgi:1,4-dihydroxy-2-naphthoate octaprenyltransferase